MLRRNFFATLLAPLVARFAPKPVLPEIYTTEGASHSCVTIVEHYAVRPSGEMRHLCSTYNDHVFVVGNNEPMMMYWTKPMNPDSWDLDA